MNEKNFIKNFKKDLHKLEHKVILPDNLNSLDIKKELTTMKKKKKFFLPIIIAAIIFTTSIAYGLSNNYFTFGFNYGDSLIKAEEKGNSNIVEKSIIDNNIELVVNAVICDGNKTSISVSAIDKKSNICGISSINVSKLSDMEGKVYPLKSLGNIDIEKPKSLKKIDMIFYGSPNKLTNLILEVNKINDKRGTWNIKFPVTKIGNVEKIILDIPLKYNGVEYYRLNEMQITSTNIKIFAKVKSRKYLSSGSNKLYNNEKESFSIGTIDSKKDNLIVFEFSPIENKNLFLEIDMIKFDGDIEKSFTLSTKLP